MNRDSQAPHNMTQLVNSIKQGTKYEYVFFSNQGVEFEHTANKHCLSQWQLVAFIEQGITFHTAAAYMMWRKAHLFGDAATAEAIANVDQIDELKTIGRSIQGFDEARWNEHKLEIVVQANYLKFSQNLALQQYLLSTNNCILVEANPNDTVWGIGLAESEATHISAEHCPGQNLLGFALMQVRSELYKH